MRFNQGLTENKNKLSTSWRISDLTRLGALPIAMRSSGRNRTATFSNPFVYSTKKPWTDEEDQRLCDIIENQGVGKWTAVGSKFEGRSGKQCRERWHNHLAPDVNKQAWTEEEDRTILIWQKRFGNVWSHIAAKIPGRTDNAIKNRFHVLQRAMKRGDEMPDMTTYPEEAMEMDVSTAAAAAHAARAGVVLVDRSDAMDEDDDDEDDRYDTHDQGPPRGSGDSNNSGGAGRMLMSAGTGAPTELAPLREGGELNALAGLALLGSSIAGQDGDLEEVVDGVMTFPNDFSGRRGSGSPRVSPRGSFHGASAGSSGKMNAGSRRASGNFSSLSSKATSRRGSSERNSFMSMESSKSTYSTSSLKSFGDVPDNSGEEVGESDFPPRHTGLASIFNAVDGGQTPSPPGSGKSNPSTSPPQQGPAKKRNLSLWQRVTHSS